MSSTEEEREVRRKSPFTDEVVEEGAFESDEGVAERNVSLDPPFVLSFDAAEREREREREREWSAFGEPQRSWMSRSFLALSQCLTQTMKVRIRLWTWLAVDREMREQNLRILLSRMLSCVRICSQKRFWMVLSTRPNCHCVSLHSTFSLAFAIGNNVQAVYILHRLLLIAHLNIKIASWGFCVLLFDSSGELAVHHADAFDVVPGVS